MLRWVGFEGYEEEAFAIYFLELGRGFTIYSPYLNEGEGETDAIRGTSSLQVDPNPPHSLW